MRHVFILPVLALALAGGSFAQARIWRCGNSYTNDQAEAQAKSCKPVEGGNVTVVSGTRVNGAAADTAAKPANASPAASNGGTRVAAAPVRVDSAEQKQRDAEAREILEGELKKAEARYADLQKEWNNGEPEKQGAETKNYQKYLDRVADLKANLTRTENDIANLKRELGRASATR